MIAVFLRATSRDYISLAWSLGFVLIAMFGGKSFISSSSYIFGFVIGLITFSIFSYAIMGAAFELQQQRQSDVFKIVQISKLGRVKYFGRFFLAKIVFISALSLLLLIVAIFLFELDISASLFIWFIFYVVYLAILGLLMGAISSFVLNTAGSLATITNVILLILIAVLSLFYSLDIFPSGVARFASFLPIEILLNMQRKGVNWVDIFLLAFYLILCLLLAVKTYRWSSR